MAMIATFVPSGVNFQLFWDERGRCGMKLVVLLVIEPIFEADFEGCSFGFRPDRNVHQALDQIQAALAAGRREVYDADLASCFDTIDHDRLMQQLRRRRTAWCWR